MPAKILYGKPVAREIRTKVKEKVELLKKKGIVPGLAVVLVGDDPASSIYVRSKARNCEKLGLYSETIRMPGETTQDELNLLIDRLNTDSRFHGILVQLPLPNHLDDSEIIHRISPEKDVDGFHPVSVGKLVLGKDTFISCTPAGILEILKYYNISPKGKHAVVVGRSNIVGKPMLNCLYQKSETGNATVTICHTRTKNLKAVTKQADILIAAAGVTPVPGGVGVMTIAMLMWNTVRAAELQLV